MSKEKTEKSKVLEQALLESCESYCDRYPRYEGELDPGADYTDFERRVLKLSETEVRKRGVCRRTSVLAASLILFCACSMALLWTYMIFWGSLTDQPPSTDWGTTEPFEGVLGPAVDRETTSGMTMETIETRPPQSTAETTVTEASSNTVTSSKPPVKEPVETSASHVFLETNGDGLQIKVTVHGYRRSDLGKLFYVKNNEYITVDVQITNLSAVPVYQWTPRDHEIGSRLYHGNDCLSSVLSDSERVDRWTVEPGEAYEWRLQFVAGEPNHGLPDGEEMDLSDFRLYGKEIYSEGVCKFSGNLFFAYTSSEDEAENALRLTVPVSIDVLYVSSEPSAQ